jgi:hypothetical protein
VLTINCEKKTVERNTECDCRRYVMSPRLLNWLFSRVQPKSMPTEMAAISSRVGERSSANMMATGMTFEALGDELNDLKKTVAGLAKTMKPTTRQASALRARLSGKKPPSTSTP